MAVNSSSPLRYPYEIVDESTDYLRIGIVEYKPIAGTKADPSKKEFTTLVGKPGSRRNGKKTKATIILPIPSNIEDGNAVSYSDSSLNALNAAIAGLSMDVMTKVGGEIGKGNFQTAQEQLLSALGNTAGKITGKEAIDLFTKQLASMAVGTLGGNISVDQLLARQDGSILNPNMELLFNGPTLRSFRFSFKMTPRSEKEMQHIKHIIRCFKQNMAPQVQSSGSGTINQNLFLKTPNVFELTYMQGNNKHSFLHNFKQCFLENMSVNYTGEGTYATYDDGTPISMVMNLQFKELEPIYNIDYTETEYTGVGY